MDKDEDAAFDLAVEAVHTRNYSEAIAGFRPLAEHGAADAQFNMALLLKAGLGQPRNYLEAYYWAVLSDLGNERRAQAMVSELSGFLPVEARAGVYDRLLARLEAQLEAGERAAIMKYARLYAEFLEEPDLERAYIWYSIAQALGIRGGAAGSAALSDQLEPDALIAAQTKAADVFSASLFSKPTASAVSE
jgi:TPR repeat protein